MPTKKHPLNNLYEYLSSMEEIEDDFPVIERAMAEPVDCFDDWTDEEPCGDVEKLSLVGPRRS